VLSRIVVDFPRGSPELLRMAKGLERAQANNDWDQCAVLFQEAAAGLSQYYLCADTWRTLLGELLRQLDVAQKGITRARKKERLERILEMQSSSPEQLQKKLAATIKSWSEHPSEAAGIESMDHESPVAQNDAVMVAPRATPLVVVPSGTSDTAHDSTAYATY
jgi:hypothetical protein